MKIGRLYLDLEIIGIGLLIFLTIYNNSVFGATLSWIVIPCLLIIFGNWFKGVRQIKLKKIWIILLWFVYFISTSFVGVVEFKRDIITFLFLCVVYIMATSREYQDEEVNLLVNIYIGVATLMALLIIYNWFNGIYEYAWIKRTTLVVNGVFKDSNYVSAFIAPGGFLSFANIFHKEKGKNKYLYSCCFLLIFISCIATSSRGALISLILAMALFFLLGSTLSFKQRIIIIIFAIVLIIVGKKFLSLMPIQALQRFSLSQGDYAENERITIWKMCLRGFATHPILGGGMESTQVYCGRASHNNYINILCDSGIVGFFFFVMFCIRNFFGCENEDRAYMFGCITVFMLPLFFINGFNSATFYTPIIMLSIISENSKNRRFD